MRKAWTMPLALAALAAFAAREPGAADPQLNALVEAERAFARASLERGMREAFLAYLADDAILFRPRPVPGKKWFLDRPATSGVLSWQPVFAALSRAGDLGYTSGPWEFRPDSADTHNVSHGHFVSVWRMQPGGEWRVLVDAGVSHPRPEDAWRSPILRTARIAARKPARRAANVEAGRRALLKTDRAFAKSCASRGVVTAYGEFAADDVRLYRQGEFPVAGKPGTLAALAAQPGVVTWSPVAGDVSRSADLGYSYGVGEIRPEGAGSPAPDSASYLRIWRKGDGSRWKVVLDIAVPIPPARKPAP